MSTRRADRVAALLLATQGEHDFKVFNHLTPLLRYSEGTGSVIQERGDREDVYTRAGEAPADDRVRLSKPPVVMLSHDHQVNILEELGLRYFSTKEVARLKLVL